MIIAGTSTTQSPLNYHTDVAPANTKPSVFDQTFAGWVGAGVQGRPCTLLALVCVGEDFEVVCTHTNYAHAHTTRNKRKQPSRHMMELWRQRVASVLQYNPNKMAPLDPIRVCVLVV